MYLLSPDFLDKLSGMSGGFFFLLFSHRPKTRWDAHEVVRFGRRVGIGLVCAQLGADSLVRYVPGLTVPLASGVLMGFGMEIVDRFVRPRVEGLRKPTEDKSNG